MSIGDVRKKWPDDYETEPQDDRGVGCPGCGCRRSTVYYVRNAIGNRRIRRRKCGHCGRLYTTYEHT